MTRTLTETLHFRVLRRRQWLAAFMLIFLHGALILDRENLLSRALMLAHVGLFLLWQPIWRGENKLTPFNAALVAAASLAFTLWLSWWLLALWLSLLSGLIGGLVFASQKRAPRWLYLAAVLYLVGALLVWVVPHLFPGEGVPQAARLIMFFGLPLVIVGMLAVPAGDEPQSLQSIDFFYSLLLFLLMVALVLGSFVLKVQTQEDYLTALASSLFIIALVLLGLSWFWNPRGGFAGLEQIFSRYLLSIGLPFEQWLYRLARVSESEDDPKAFLALACADLSEVPGILGGEWQSPDGAGRFGGGGENPATFESPPLVIVLYAKSPFSPAMLLHFNLLVQLVGVFYQSKRREQMLEQQAYLQAVHETGARLTHDVKNLLQSLKGLCAAAEMGRNGDACSLQSLFSRQLPRITQRLEQTLEKLRQPGGEDGVTQVNAGIWWEILRQRYATDDVDFERLADASDITLPAEMFDSVADNLLQNALEKRKLNYRLAIRVSLILKPTPVLQVCDDGDPVEGLLLNKLFAAPVPSRNGLGIGLYQSRQLAMRYGYVVGLPNNESGRVCFELREPVSA